MECQVGGAGLDSPDYGEPAGLTRASRDLVYLVMESQMGDWTVQGLAGLSTNSDNLDSVISIPCHSKISMKSY